MIKMNTQFNTNDFATTINSTVFPDAVKGSAQEYVMYNLEKQIVERGFDPSTEDAMYVSIQQDVGKMKLNCTQNAEQIVTGNKTYIVKAKRVVGSFQQTYTQHLLAFKEKLIQISTNGVMGTQQQIAQTQNSMPNVNSQFAGSTNQTPQIPQFPGSVTNTPQMPTSMNSTPQMPTSMNSTPQMQAPGMPGMTTPGMPGMTTPGMPGMTTPGMPNMQAPGMPNMQAPGMPGMPTPGMPGMQVPQNGMSNMQVPQNGMSNMQAPQNGMIQGQNNNMFSNNMQYVQQPVTAKSILIDNWKNTKGEHKTVEMLSAILGSCYGYDNLGQPITAKIFAKKTSTTKLVAKQVVKFYYSRIPLTIDDIKVVIESSGGDPSYGSYSFGETDKTLKGKYEGSIVNFYQFTEALFSLFIETFGRDGVLDQNVVNQKTQVVHQSSSKQQPMGQMGSMGQQPMGQMGSMGQQPMGQMGSMVQQPMGQMGSMVQQPMGQMGSMVQQPMGQMGSMGQQPNTSMLLTQNPFPKTVEVKKTIYQRRDEALTLDQFKPYMKDLKCMVVKVIDGDTFDVAVLEPFSSYTSCRRHTLGGKVDESPMCINTGESSGEALKVLRVRGQNYDAAEYHIRGKRGKKSVDIHNEVDDDDDQKAVEMTTKEGWLAFLLISKFFAYVEKTNGILTIDMFGLGQYERYQGSIKLGEIVVGEALSNIDLDGKKISLWGYSGKKKSTFSDDLAKYPLNDLLSNQDEVTKMNGIVETKFTELMGYFPNYPKYETVSSTPTIQTPTIGSMGMPTLPAMPVVNQHPVMGMPTPPAMGMPTPPAMGMPVVNQPPAMGMPVVNQPPAMGMPVVNQPPAMGMPVVNQPPAMGMPVVNQPPAMGMPVVNQPPAMGMPVVNQPPAMGMPTPPAMGMPTPPAMGMPTPPAMGMPTPPAMGMPTPPAMGMPVVNQPPAMGMPVVNQPPAMGMPPAPAMGMPSAMGMPTPPAMGMPVVNQPPAMGMPVVNQAPAVNQNPFGQAKEFSMPNLDIDDDNNSDNDEHENPESSLYENGAGDDQEPDMEEMDSD